MEWEEINIERCPTCKSNWKNDGSNDYLMACRNYMTCKTYKSKDGFIRRRIISDEKEMCLIVWNLNSKECRVSDENDLLLVCNYVLPFDITPEKLKTYILFS
jgi:Zn-finger nucleic acid-binding protein